MKKVVKFIICLLLVFCLLSPIASFATTESGDTADESSPSESPAEDDGAEMPGSNEEAPANPNATDDNITDDTPGETVDPGTEDSLEGKPIAPDDTADLGKETIDTYTLFGRLWEFVEENSSEVMSFISAAAILIYNAFANAKSNKEGRLIKDNLLSIKTSSTRTANSQSSVIDVVNTMADGYNEMRDYYEKMRGTEDDRNRLIGAVAVQNTAILEMLSSVYVHNKNLPQGVKDLVVLKYANCMKTLNDDEVLKEVTESVREIINKHATAEIQNQTEIVAENAEV